YPAVETVDCEDAELVLVTSSSMTSPARLVIRRLREAGKKVGLMKIRMFRPFPAETICRLLRGKQKAVVVDRNFSWGGSGIFAAEIRAALANERHAPVIHGYISGLGGKSVTPERLTDMVEESWKNSLPRSPAIWKGISA
ncbi:MAG: transketolase C-terminal domain-containing protein, partial [Deltaproteobacteria bacterium]|nr:transketolase C-terminal domain-containing protein [Deltaproteobacteria bacterium]